jgi:hypothetical protein
LQPQLQLPVSVISASAIVTAAIATIAAIITAPIAVVMDVSTGEKLSAAVVDAPPLTSGIADAICGIAAKSSAPAIVISIVLRIESSLR